MDGLCYHKYYMFYRMSGTLCNKQLPFSKKSPYKVICVTPLTGRYYIYLYIYIFIYNIYIILHIYFYVYIYIYFYIYIYMNIYMDIEVAVRTLPQESRLFKYKKK